MVDNYIRTETENGNINISEDVIAVMVSAAINEVDGVAGFTNTVGSEILDLIGMKTLSKGIKVSIDEDIITVDVLLTVDFGCVVADVAKKVQCSVIGALEAMTGLSAKVNVHVSGVSFRSLAEK